MLHKEQLCMHVHFNTAAGYRSISLFWLYAIIAAMNKVGLEVIFTLF